MIEILSTDALQHAQSATALRSPLERTVESSEKTSSFLDFFKGALEQTRVAQTQAEVAVKQFQLGQNNATLEDAVIAMQKANIPLQLSIQVRNKLVAAYSEVMNMQM